MGTEIWILCVPSTSKKPHLFSFIPNIVHYGIFLRCFYGPFHISILFDSHPYLTQIDKKKKIHPLTFTHPELPLPHEAQDMSATLVQVPGVRPQVRPLQVRRVHRLHVWHPWHPRYQPRNLSCKKTQNFSISHACISQESCRSCNRALKATSRTVTGSWHRSVLSLLRPISLQPPLQ